MKFFRQLEIQMIPEWKDAFLNYGHLKKIIKKIKSLRPAGPDTPFASAGFSVVHPIRSVASPLSRRRSVLQLKKAAKQNEQDQVQSREDEVKVFFARLDEELQKVDGFYEDKEMEFIERADVLAKQLQILLDFKRILDEHHLLVNNSDSVSKCVSRSLSHLSSPTRFSQRGEETERDSLPEMSSSPMGKMMEVLEKNGVSFRGSTAMVKRAVNPRTPTTRIDIPNTTPTRKLLEATSVIWEDMVKNRGTSTRKIRNAEKMIRKAYVELYRGLGLLKNFSSLNMTAFRKILKKLDKVANCEESEKYLHKVEMSLFVSSDKVIKLSDEVERVFTDHLTNNNRKKAMEFLRPQQPKESHIISFFAGLFTGSFVTMFSIYAILAHVSGVLSSEIGDDSAYMETVYPIFCMFALLSLHIFMYGCNLYAWKRTRINHNFIFEFHPNTALTHRDAFLISASIMTMVVGAMVVHLLLVSAGVVSNRHVDAIPGILLILFLVLLLCPLNILYRSTRYCFLRVIRNIVLSPLYRVYMVDFFLADQLTSQIPLLRHMEFTSCFFIAGGFKKPSYATCKKSMEFKILAYMISLLPYFWRAMQCLRRYMEEGRDLNHIANTGKYISALVAASVRMKHAVSPTQTWMGMVILTSTIATTYQLYWDFVKDWGFFCKGSRNRWLRDDLVLKNKSTYYFSIVLNLVLRLAWIQTVIDFNLSKVENRIVNFFMASLEVIRRGHWNYYRLENEHLNNVGKFRAVKAVPLPFPDIDSD